MNEAEQTAIALLREWRELEKASELCGRCGFHRYPSYCADHAERFTEIREKRDYLLYTHATPATEEKGKEQ